MIYQMGERIKVLEENIVDHNLKIKNLNLSSGINFEDDKLQILLKRLIV